MKNKNRIFGILITLLLFTGCQDLLDLKPLDKVGDEVVFSNEDGIKAYLANLYYRSPFEEFNHTFNGPHTGWGLWHGMTSDVLADNAAHSEFNYEATLRTSFSYWPYAYSLNRDINYLLKSIAKVSFLNEERKKELTSEVHFLRAFNYFTLAKWYGGVPLIPEYQAYTTDIESLKVPRSTEKDTWDFVLSECDKAILNLPPSRSGDNANRATKWAACALKSRAALHAASLAKYWQKAPLSGDAVTQKLVGLDASLANDYYKQCIEASHAVMESGQHTLYKPEPASVNEAIDNYMALFQDPHAASTEGILFFGYTKTGVDGHTMDLWCGPNQTADGSPYPGRINPSLDFVDVYENYDNPGHDAPIITTTDGKVGDYNGYNSAKSYLKFDTPSEIFKGKDARLWATAVLPGTEWKGAKINIQAGFIKPDGTAVIEADKASVVIDGKTYHTFGADSWKDYSGFDSQHVAEMTRTGFCFKKFLSPTTVSGNNSSGASLTDWMEFRYAEVLLNYAEAVVESGYAENNAQAKALTALNATRRRAGHTTEIPLTLDNVLRERRVELAFENKRWWDLIRRRDMHEVLNSHIFTALCPVLDLSVTPHKYIFVRKYVARGVPSTIPSQYYYMPIPGTNANGAIQNPQF